MSDAADWVAAHPCLRHSQVSSDFDPAVAAAGLTDVTPHDLRTSHGTWVADRYGVMTAAHRLGHSNASVTTRHHARPLAGRDDQVAAASDLWLSGSDAENGGSAEAISD